jgi:transcriptional regulator with XRE-family HTH domain
VITGAQIREARRLLGWSADRLAARSKVPLGSVERAELIDGQPRVPSPHLEEIQKAFEAAGIEFSEQWPGAKLKR